MAKLLLVEDDNNLREIYEARLQAEGYTIVTAKDGEEALVVAKAERPDLIISDIMMPKISGFEMLDILRNTDNLKTVPVIMLTALGQNDDQQRADKLGADRYLVKSQVTLEDIVRVAHELLADLPAPETEPAAAPPPAAPAPVAVPPEPATPPPAPAPDPAPSPSDVPAPAPEAEDTSTTTAAETSVEEAATQSTAQEGADMDARIEDFVAGASQDASTPAASDTTDATPSDSPAEEEEVPTDSSTEPVLPEPAAPDESSDSQSSTPPAESSPSIEIGGETEAVSDQQPPDNSPSQDDTAAAPDVSENTEDESTNTTSAVVHDKVIQPLQSDPKKDINTLLALEEAKNTSEETPPLPAPVIVDAKAAVAPVSPVVTSEAASSPEPSPIISTQSAGPPAPPTAAEAEETATTDLNGIAL